MRLGYFLPALTLAWGGLTRHRLRSLVSCLGVIIAVAAVVSVMAVTQGARREVLERLGRLGTRGVLIRAVASGTGEERVMRHGLDLDDLRALGKGVPDLTTLAAMTPLEGHVREARGEDLGVLAVTPGFAETMGLAAASGRLLADLDGGEGPPVAVVGAGASSLLGAAGRVGGVIHLEDRPHRVVGVLAPRAAGVGRLGDMTLPDLDRAVLLPLSPLENRGVAEISLVAPDPALVTLTAQVAGRLMQKRRPQGGWEVVVPADMLAEVRRTRRSLGLVLLAVAGISLLVGGVGVMNVMLAGVYERTREIGILRAVGASRAHVLAAFLTEAVLLTGAGGILGLILGWAGAALMGGIAGWPVEVTPGSAILGLAMAAGVGLVSGWHPARRAAELPPMAALRA